MIISAETIPENSITRCGVIPYTILEKDFYFLLARDVKSQDLADFGGGVKKCERVQPYLAGVRECEEESRGLFPIPSNDLKDKPAIVQPNQKMAIIFYPIHTSWYKTATKIFSETQPTSKAAEEVSELVWVSLSELHNLVRCRTLDQKMWTRMRIFLNNTLFNHRYMIGIKQKLWTAYESITSSEIE